MKIGQRISYTNFAGITYDYIITNITEKNICVAAEENILITANFPIESVDWLMKRCM